MSNNGELSHSADVVIIGGGVIGTAIAYFLARTGAEVCLLERHDIGAGTSSAAAAAALLQTKTSAKKLALASKSLALLDELSEELDHSFEYDHSGSLLVANSEAEMDVVKNTISRNPGILCNLILNFFTLPLNVVNQTDFSSNHWSTNYLPR